MRILLILLLVWKVVFVQSAIYKSTDSAFFTQNALEVRSGDLLKSPGRSDSPGRTWNLTDGHSSGCSGCMHWQDNEGNFYFFGSAANKMDGTYAGHYSGILWKYNTGTDRYEHQGGEIFAYPTESFPGSRLGSCGTQLSDGRFIFYGGSGHYSEEKGTHATHLSNLWQYDIWTETFTMIDGILPVEPTRGGTAQRPGARVNCIMQADANDNLYMWGGSGYQNKTFDVNAYPQESLWKIVIRGTSVTWELLSGTLLRRQDMDIPANGPNARTGSLSWFYGDSLYIYGGVAKDVDGTTRYWNDLWAWNTLTNDWKQVIAAKTVGDPYKNYTSGTPQGDFTSGVTTWVDHQQGILYFYGGTRHYSDCLWEYKVAEDKWNLVRATVTSNRLSTRPDPVYQNPGMWPGGLSGAGVQRDIKTGAIWVFGGWHRQPEDEVWRFAYNGSWTPQNFSPIQTYQPTDAPTNEPTGGPTNGPTDEPEATIVPGDGSPEWFLPAIIAGGALLFIIVCIIIYKKTQGKKLQVSNVQLEIQPVGTYTDRPMVI